MEKLMASRHRSGWTILFGLVFTGLVALFLVAGDAPGPVTILVCAFLAWSGLSIAVKGVRSALASARVGNLEIMVSARQLPVGGSFRLSCRHDCRRAVDVSRFVAQLVLRETVRYSDGENTSTARHEEVVQRVERPGRRFERGEVFVDDFDFGIPLYGMHTFAPSADNRIEWYVTITVELARWPDLHREYEVTVLPELVG